VMYMPQSPPSIPPVIVPVQAPVTVGMQSSSVDKTKTFGGSSQIDLALFDGHYTIAGVQYLKDKLDTKKHTQPRVQVQMGPTLVDPSIPAIDTFNQATMQTASAFMQDEWTLPNDFKLIAGARYYHVKSKLEIGRASCRERVERSEGE